MLFRTQIWNNLVNIKFKAYYLSKCSAWADLAGRAYSIIIAIGTASSIAVWAIWQQYPTTWAIIVGLSQVLHIIKPYVRFIGKEKEFMDASYKFERLYLDYENLWKSVERNELNENEADKIFQQLKNKELDITEKLGTSCPKSQKRMDDAYNETIRFFNINYPNIA